MSKMQVSRKPVIRGAYNVLDLPVAYRCDESILMGRNLPGETLFDIDDEPLAPVGANGEILDPLRGIESAELVKALAMPGLRLDAKFLLVSSCSIAYKSSKVRLHLDSEISDNLGRFLITQKHQGTLPEDYSPMWQKLVPELTINRADERHLNVSKWTIWHTIAGSGKNGVDVWLVPIGYFNVKKTAEGKFSGKMPGSRFMLADGADNAYELFEDAAAEMGKLYRQAYLDLELKHQEAAEAELTQQIDQAAKQEQLQEICDGLNERLNVVQQHKMSYIGRRVRFIVNSSDYIELDSSRPRSFYLDGAEQYMRKLELELEAYDKFQPEFEAMRERIENAGGMLMTADSVYKATARFPRETPDPKDGSVYEERPFPFAWVGVSSLKSWLEEVEDHTDDAIADVVKDEEE